MERVTASGAAPALVTSTRPLSSRANLAELAYRDRIQLEDPKYRTLEQWKALTTVGTRRIVPFLDRRGIGFRGRVLEIGAGACWLSAEISKAEEVEHVHAVDFSRALLERIAPKIIDHLGGRHDKITRVVGDFNALDFPDGSFDYVVCDAALHHANDPIWLLGELRRVLKRDGTVVAIREPVLSEVSALAVRQARNFGLEERQFGVTERIYRYAEWQRLFAQAGFEVRFVPFIHHTSVKGLAVRFSPLRLLNGYLFFAGPFVARKAQTAGRA